MQMAISDKFGWIKKPISVFIIGLFVGGLTIIGLRALLVTDQHTHYHANFGLYINGERDTFSSPLFYEEVQSCSSEDDNNPKHRVHMHNQQNDAVHVHAEAATWGHFFANLGYGLTNDSVKTDKGVFVDGQDGKKLTFILNGEKVSSVANRVIQSEDTLLIDYGDGSSTQQRYDSINKSAGEYNLKPDPAACSGDENLSASERLKRAVDFRH
jgi:hypothetical protein